MNRPLSLTLRLTLLFSFVATIGLLTFGYIIERSLINHFNAEDIKELNVVADAVEDSLGTLQSGNNINRVIQRFDDILIGHHGALLYVADVNGEPLYTSHGPDLSAIPASAPPLLNEGEIRHWKNTDHNYKIFIKQIPGLATDNNAPYLVIVAVGTDFHLHFLTKFHRALWLMVTCGIIIMAIMGWLAVRQGHRPLRHMVERIGQVSASELSARIDPKSVPIEITELAVSFNDLLQRLEEAFNRLSNFSADIAHELRTPISNLMTQTQVSISQARSAEEYQEILYSNMEEYERLAQMIGDMLFLAKADNGLTPPNSEEIDLAKEVRNLFDYYEALAEEQRVALNLEGDGRVNGDRLMLRRALNNLVSNAIRHTTPNNTVTVKLATKGNKTSIVVQNPGTPLAPEHLDKIFDRFYRVDPSRQRSSEGAGLGLAIVKSIVEAHGGEIMATSDEAHTRFQVSLPNTTSL